MSPSGLLRRQAGVSLIEVLIAILVLAVGALGFAAFQFKAMEHSENANYRSAAMLIAQDAVERIQSNPQCLDLYKNKEGSCASAGVVSDDLEELEEIASRSLPNGRVVIDDCAFNGLSCVLLQWGKGLANAADPSQDCMSAAGINISTDANCLVLEFTR